MAVLEKVRELQKQGLSESQITQSLMNENISPMEISEALSQSKIKSAVSESFEGMQPSAMIQEQVPVETPVPQVQMPQQAYAQQNYAPQETYQQYPQEQQEQTYYNQGFDLETIRDLARREIESSMLKIRQQIDYLSKNVAEISAKLKIADSKINTAESSIRELNSAIIKKVGEYGEAMVNLSDEMKATQKSFAKVLNPILDKRPIETEEENEESESPKEETRKPRANFEKFLR